MANVIKCPTCGENNLPDQEFCQYCQARLQPLTGNLKGEDKPLTPGQLPTKKITADLEPVLPQWLREARSSARQSAEEEMPSAPQTPKSDFSGADLLAGLHSQTDDEEEDTPDWLANITGETAKPKKSQPESSDVRWVELGAKKDFAQPEPEPDDVPSWLLGINQPAPQNDEKDDLADWMRKAETPKTSQQFPPSFSFDNNPPTASDAGSAPDWLHSMGAEDVSGFNDSENTADEPFTPSDTPDWLRAMDAENAAPKVDSTSGSTDTPDWLRAMDAESAAPKSDSTLGSTDTPDWLRAMEAESAAPKADSTSGSTDTPDWLRVMDAESAAPKSDSTSGSTDTPDWLRAMDAESAAPKADSTSGSTDTPDWLRAMDAESAAPKADSTSGSTDTPDWLRAMEAESAAPSPSAPFDSSDLSSWLIPADEQQEAQSTDKPAFSESGLGETDAVFSSAGDTPDWLKGLDTSSSEPDWLKGFQSTENEKSAKDSTLAWLSSDALPEPVEENRQEKPAVTEAADLDIPNWLKAAAPQSSIFTEPSAVPSSEDTTGWSNTFKSVDTPAPSAEKPVEAVPPAFTGNAQPNTGGNTDALFTEMPDWLSIVDDSASSESVPAPITNVDAIAPGDLPSWVQAMRPVDAGVPQISTSLSGDKAMESRGALAGLQGVLPVGTSFNPTSKPKAYSIKLHTSEEQQAHAALLDQLLSAETAPVPLDSFSAIGTSRGLRWLLAFLFFTVLTISLSMQTRIFALPSSLFVPLEFGGALQAAQVIPEGAPVLVIFDYQPARVGEIEAAAAPMFDQMILLRHPRLTFVSTNETGAILAERFISSGPLAVHNYQSGIQYLNLGYLPGGQMGIRAFAENPSVTAKYTVPQSSNLIDVNPTLAWTLPPLEGVTSLSQFAAWILITDDADSARLWIEQTMSARGTVPFVVISSAQAAPMLQPYYASKQINGLVSGLYGGALFEQNNAGRPGTARAYWDAYSIGMLLAMALILVGGLLNLALGLRDRALTREAK